MFVSDVGMSNIKYFNYLLFNLSLHKSKLNKKYLLTRSITSQLINLKSKLLKLLKQL